MKLKGIISDLTTGVALHSLAKVIESVLLYIDYRIKKNEDDKLIEYTEDE